MNNLTNLLFIILILSGCSNLEKRQKERALQTKILATIKDKTPSFSSCAKNHKIFKHFNAQRVRVELDVTLNNLGQIEAFQTDKKRYPDDFLDCIFSILDNTKFPKLNNGEAVQFTQPFIFRND